MSALCWFITAYSTVSQATSALTPRSAHDDTSPSHPTLSTSSALEALKQHSRILTPSSAAYQLRPPLKPPSSNPVRADKRRHDGNQTRKSLRGLEERFSLGSFVLVLTLWRGKGTKKVEMDEEINIREAFLGFEQG
ncbi:hypothetical protein F4604DRAFT_1678421 [Suillus subluteus]|nr:hypothetical protein F4604DRAFT_1678421 [Suillus subluteus]